MSIIVLSNHTRIGAWVTRKCRGTYCTISSLIAMHRYRTQNIQGKPGLQLCLQKNQNAPRPSEFVTLHLGSDGVTEGDFSIIDDVGVILGNCTIPFVIRIFVVVFFILLTDRASTIPISNIRGCQSGTWSAGQKKIRGTSTKLQWIA